MTGENPLIRPSTGAGVDRVPQGTGEFRTVPSKDPGVVCECGSHASLFPTTPARIFRSSWTRVTGGRGSVVGSMPS